MASEGERFLEDNRTKPGVSQLSSGLQYKVLKEGAGMKHPTRDSPCECHYCGSLIDGTTFDSSYERGKPSTFAPNQVIKGWTQAMQLMVEGDKWEMYIPYYLAYGEAGKPPKIPPKATLVFVMEIVKIKGGSTPIEFPEWTADEEKHWTAKDQASCDTWRAGKVEKFEAGDSKLKAKYLDRAALDAWLDATCQDTKNKALWKRTKKAKAAAAPGDPSLKAAPQAKNPASSAPKPFGAVEARKVLDGAMATFREPANKAKLTGIIQEIEAAPGDASSKQMQKMMRLMPAVQEICAPALEANGYKKDDLMELMMKINGLAVEDPSIAKDTMALMKAAQGDLSAFQ